MFAWGELGGDAASPTRGRSTALEAAPRAKTSTMPPNLMQLMLRGLAARSRAKTAPGFDINIKVARSACLRLLRRGGASWRRGPWLALAKVLDAVVGRAVSLAETANRRATSSMDDWRSEPAFLLNLAPAAHGRCAGAVKCASCFHLERDGAVAKTRHAVNDMSPRDASQAEPMRTDHQTAAHNRWLAAEIQDALDDPRPSLPLEEAMAAMEAEIDAVERVSAIDRAPAQEPVPSRAPRWQ